MDRLSQRRNLGRYRIHPTLLGEPLPRTLSLEVTNHCNLSCSHCGHSQYPEFRKGYLDESLLEKVRHLLGPGKIAAVNLSDFGEPFMSKNWWSIYEQVGNIPGLEIGFITNGLLIDRHLDKFDRSGLNISISIDGASEATYGHFRGQGNFAKLVANLELIRERELAGALPRSNRGFIVVLSRVNVQEMPAIVALAARLGVSSVVFSFQVFFDEQRFRGESLYFAREAYDQYLVEALERADALGVQLVHPPAFSRDLTERMARMPRLWLWRDEQGRLRCGAVGANCYVKFHGQVEACCVPDRYPLGDLNADTFMDIWHGPYYRRLRQSFAQGVMLPGCLNCNLMQSVDPNLEQSHAIPLTRDNGDLIPMPQPYQATQLDRQYRRLLEGLEGGGDLDALIAELRHMLVVDDRLHEAANMLGVAWMAKGNRERGRLMFEYAARLAPEDRCVEDNLRAFAD